MLRKITILLTLVILLNSVFVLPSFAQPELEKEPSSISYIPKQPNIKDEQNIDFLYELAKENTSFSDMSPLDKTAIMLVGRKAFAQYYYSPESFSLRESMKLYRAMTCKASRISGVRGIDLVDKLLKSDKQNNLSNYDSGFKLWKSAYEHFCPNLW
jgi:hypothetical protein